MPENDPASGRADLLSTAVPWGVLVIAAVVLVAAWVAAHRHSHRFAPGATEGARRPAGRLALVVSARLVVGAAALWAIFQVLGRWLVLATPWPLAGLAVAGAAAVEIAAVAYGWERRQLGPRRGRWVLGLRLAAIALVVFMLAQPVFTREVTRRIEREVAVLVDDSRSMRLVDGELDASERLRLAALYGIEGVGEVPALDALEDRVAGVAAGIEEPFAQLAAYQGGDSGIASPGSGSVPTGLGDSLVVLAERAAEAAEEADGLAMVLERDGAPDAVRAVPAAIGPEWRDEVAGGLERAERALRSGRFDVAFESVRVARERVREVAGALPSGRRAVDAWRLAELPAGVREQIAASARRTRAEIARDVLVLPGADEGPPLVDALAGRYGLRFIRFGREAVEVAGVEAIAPGGSDAVVSGDPVVAGQWVRADHAVRFLVPDEGALPAGWSGPAFDDGSWREGRGVLGFSDDAADRARFDTRLDGVLRNQGSGILLRYAFEVEDPAAFDSLVLGVRYDDGFVARLNGVEIARRGVPEGDLDASAEAVVDRVWNQVDAGESIDATGALAHVVPGRNVLAVHAVNAGSRDNDFLFAATLAARGVPAGTDDDAAAFATETDIAGAIDRALETISPDSLAGVLLLSDGRHNAESQADDVARRLGIQGTPVGAVAIGAAAGPPDASILDVQVPESIYLGDKIVVRAEIKADGLRGRRVRAVLEAAGAEEGGEPLDEVVVEVPDARFTTTVRFRHVPGEKGVDAYRVRLEPVEGETFPDNNAWPFEVAVTDDRKNVLLVDSVPRWEFRYLRNLFFARDKSVHLQHVLLEPERIEGAPPLPSVAASASRPFGDAEATRLPESREEWLKFDAIILGDVPPAVFGEEVWGILDECVRERGALLVVVAGPRFMPHAFASRTFRELMPVEFEVDPRPLFESVEPVFRLALTAEGKGSEIMRQAPSALVNARIWAGMPDLYWRHPHRGAKEAASVLAYAVEPGDAEAPAFGSLLERRETERARALIATQRLSPGSVCLLLTDRTWRFRSGVGDTYHHRFWGQLLRWGTGENLRSGTEFARLGTDRLSYEPGEPVRILARLSDRSHRPLRDDRLEAAVFRDGEEVARGRLIHREGSNGMHELVVEGLEKDGRYRVVVDSDEVRALLAGEGGGVLDTEFRIHRETNPRELAELTVDLPFLERVASLSGGRVVSSEDARDLVTLFGEPSKLVDEVRETSLWDNWVLMLLFIGVVTTEWLVRRQGGLV